MRSICLTIIALLMFGCSNERERSEISIKVKLMYPFYPWEQFIIKAQGDSNYFECQKLYHATDSIYKIASEPKWSYRKVIEQISPHFFSIKIMQTDSVHYCEGINFVKDHKTNQIVIKEIDKTKWTLIDSMAVSEVMSSYKKKLSDNDFENVIGIVERLKSQQQKETSPCLDGTTTVLEYRKNGVPYSFELGCDYRGNEFLEMLVHWCKSQSK